MALLSPKDLEQESGFRAATWRLWIKQGLVPAVRLGRALRVDEQDYRRLLETHRQPAMVATVEAS